MKKIALILLFLQFLVYIYAHEIDTTKLPFKIGEKSSYSVYFNLGFIWINAADVEFEAKDGTYNGNSAYEFRMTAATAKSLSILDFKDTISTYADKNTLSPYFMREAAFEPKYYAINNYTFLNESANRQIIIDKEREKGNSQEVFDVEKPYYDLLSTLYRLRSVDINSLIVGHEISMPMVFSDGAYDLSVIYAGKEQIKLKNGKVYNCIKITPSLAEGKFFDKGEKMTIWLSDDENRIPLMIETKMKVGWVKAMLNNVENAAYPMLSEVVKKKK